MTTTVRSTMDEQQPLPPPNAVSTDGNDQQQVIPTQPVLPQEHEHTNSADL